MRRTAFLVAPIAGLLAVWMAVPTAPATMSVALAQAATCTVTTSTDTGTGSGASGDLRYCITRANAVAGDDTIGFDTASIGSTITLTSVLPNIMTNITLAGPGASLLNVHQGTANTPIFNVFGNTLTIDALTISGGTSNGHGGAITAANSGVVITNSVVSGNNGAGYGGGAIYAWTNSTVTISDSTLTGNTGIEGTAVYAAPGNVTLTNCIVSANTGTSIGSSAALAAQSTNQSAHLTVTDTIVSGNKNSADVTGGIFVGSYGGSPPVYLTVTGSTISGNDGTGILSSTNSVTTITDSTISGNQDYDGGGGIVAYNYGQTTTVTVTNSTVSGNWSSMGRGAGIETSGANLTLINSTVTNNDSAVGSAGINVQSGPVPVLRNTVVAGNIYYWGSVPSDIGGLGVDVANSYNNLIGTGGSGGLSNGTQGNRVGIANPGLTALGDYGGTTQTMALLPGSPAIGAASDTYAPATDQRGIARDDGAPDIGAFESRGFTIAKASGDDQATAVSTAFADPLVVAVSSAVNEPVVGGTVSFTPPATGASAVLSASTATIGGDEHASVTATANDIAGSYSVTGAASGATPVTFTLTNQPHDTIHVTVSGSQDYGGSSPAFTKTSDEPAGVSLDGTVVCTKVVGGASIDSTLAAGTYTIDGSSCYGLTASDPGYAISYQGLDNGFLVIAPSYAVTISQVYGGGGSSSATLRHDYVELYNAGEVPVDVTGWSVQYASYNGSTWTATTLSGVIPPGAYYLVQESGGMSGAALPVAPGVVGTIAMSATHGKVALLYGSTVLTGSCPTGGALVDFVGYGSETTCSEAAPTGDLSPTTAALRKGGGATDTDDNLADFTIGSPDPRNTSLPGPVTTTTGLQSSLNPSTVGQSVTLTATVTAGSRVPVGDVRFMDGDTQLAEVALNNLAGAQLSVSDLSEGEHALTAVYVPATDSGYAGSTSEVVDQVVNAGATLSAVSGTGVYGATATLTATLTAGATGLGGITITFKLDGVEVGTAVTDEDGVATLSGVSLVGVGAGTHDDAVQADFAGNATFAATTGKGDLVVAKAPSVISINNLPTDAQVGGSFTPQYDATGDGAKSTVSTTLDICTVASGVVSFDADGTCVLHASIGEGPNYLAATGVDQQFTIARMTTAMSSVSGSGTFGGTATLSATLGAGSAGLSGKTVTFSLNGIDVGHATTNTSGVATLPSVDLAGIDAGSFVDAVDAVFAGDTMYTDASASGDMVVGRADQTIDFGSLPDRRYDDPPFELSASASSGLAVSFTASGSCTVSGVMVTITSLGSCTVTASQDGNGNYNPAPSVDQAFAVGWGIGKVAYIGPTLMVTSGSKTTTVRVPLSASVEATAGDITHAKVTFVDDSTGIVLAKGVPVSPVPGSTTPTGTANTTVTLSAGRYGAQSYLVRVVLDTSAGSSYTNADQLADSTSSAFATVTVLLPSVAANSFVGTASLTGTGCPTSADSCAPAGVYANGANVQYTAGLQYNKAGTNVQGQVQLALELGNYRYYIKSNSISSIAFTNSTRKDVTIYAKASVYRIDGNGVQTSVDGGATLRIDAHDGGTTADTIGLTLLSGKGGLLYYSNNWVYDSTSRSWRTVQQAVSGAAGTAVQIK